MSLSTARPFAITLTVGGQEALTKLIEWIMRATAFAHATWTVVDIECVEGEEAPAGTVLPTAALATLLASQVIELDLEGRHGHELAWRLRVSDGMYVDFLGRGAPPSPMEVGAYNVEDPAQFYWE